MMLDMTRCISLSARESYWAGSDSVIEAVTFGDNEFRRRRSLIYREVGAHGGLTPEGWEVGLFFRE
jgi:hypothetical protein